jgi:hypothetical protein
MTPIDWHGGVAYQRDSLFGDGHPSPQKDLGQLSQRRIWVRSPMWGAIDSTYFLMALQGNWTTFACATAPNLWREDQDVHLCTIRQTPDFRPLFAALSPAFLLDRTNSWTIEQSHTARRYRWLVPKTIDRTPIRISGAFI